MEIGELRSLLTEQRNPASMEIDKASTIDALRIMNDEDRKIAESITPELPAIARAVDAIVERLTHGGHLYYIGAGTSGRLGVLDASECPPTFNVPYEMVQGIVAGGYDALYKATESREDSPEAGARDLVTRGVASGDVLCGIAASGRTPYVLGAIRAARHIGILTIGISCSPNSELARATEIAITPLPGPEVVTGSTRLKAGTATKLVLNMLTTVSMIRMGYVWSNLMINVQPKNDKLVARAKRIISEAAGVDETRAEELLASTEGNVREAIRRGVEAKNG